MTEKYFANCFLNSFEVLFFMLRRCCQVCCCTEQRNKKAIKQKLCCESILTVDSRFFVGYMTLSTIGCLSWKSNRRTSKVGASFDGFSHAKCTRIIALKWALDNCREKNTPTNSHWVESFHITITQVSINFHLVTWNIGWRVSNLHS